MITILKKINFWINSRQELGYDANQLLKIRAKISQNKYNFLCKWIMQIKYKNICKKNGAFFRLSTIVGEGVTFPHGIAGVFISQGAVIGDNCVIFHQVTIGSNTLGDSINYGAPTIGNNVYIGAGAKIIGNVIVGDNVRIGANAIITKDIVSNSTVIMSHPRIIVHDSPKDNCFVRY